MNLKAIKERCERFSEIQRMSKTEMKKLDWDEWYGPTEEIQIAVGTVEHDLPALLEWVERIKAEVIQMCEDAQMEGAFSEACVRAQELLAELEE